MGTVCAKVRGVKGMELGTVADVTECAARGMRPPRQEEPLLWAGGIGYPLCPSVPLGGLHTREAGWGTDQKWTWAVLDAPPALPHGFVA